MERERDRISLRGLKFYAYHGAMPEEKVLGQRFSIDVDLFQSLHTAGESDRVEDTINYAEVYEMVKRVVSDEHCHLIERLAQRIVDRIFAEFSCDAIRIEIHKPEAPIPGVLEDVSINIYRERDR